MTLAKAAMQGEAHRHFDLAHFTKVTDGDAETQIIVLDIYLESGATVLSEFEQFLAAKDAAALAEVAHRYRGGIGAFGAHALVAGLARVEIAATNQNFTIAAQEVAVLLPWMRSLLAELAAFRAGLGG